MNADESYYMKAMFLTVVVIILAAILFELKDSMEREQWLKANCVCEEAK